MRAATSAALWALCLVAAGCSAGNTQATPPPSARQPVAPASRYAFAQQDTPYEQVLASARSSGRPALLFFWTSW